MVLLFCFFSKFVNRSHMEIWNQSYEAYFVVTISLDLKYFLQN